MLSKCFIHFFFFDGQGCVFSLLFDLIPNYGWGNEDNGDLLLKVPCKHCCTQCPHPFHRPHASWPMPSPEIPGHSQPSVDQSLVGSLLLSPVSWCAEGFVCALHECVSLVLCKFCNQIPLASKVKFPGGSQSLCQFPRLENLLWVLELYSQCEDFVGIIVLQFMGHLPVGSIVVLMATSSKWAYGTGCVRHVCCTQSPCPCARSLLTCTSVVDTQTLKVRSASVSVGSLCPSTHRVLFEPFELKQSPLQSSWGFSFDLGCGVSFFGGIQYSPVSDCSAVSCNFGVHAGVHALLLCHLLYPWQREVGVGVDVWCFLHELVCRECFTQAFCHKTIWL